VPQESTMQPTPAGSPTLKRFTPRATRVTRPTISWPGTMGKIDPPHSSRAWWMSEWQMPHHSMAISTSLLRGSRRSITVGASGEVAVSAA
jgi:hypothetical protein